MEEQGKIEKLGMLVLVILAGTAWTVSSYLDSKELDPARGFPAAECADCPELEIRTTRPDPEAFTSLVAPARNGAG